jgi:cell wall-associated NlpC family hydrolase
MDTCTLQPGDIIFFQGTHFISRGIRAFTNSKWSHVALYVGNGYVIEATAAGVEKNKLDPLTKRASRIAVGRIPDLKVEDMTRMIDKAYSLIGEKYDVWQLLTFGIYFAFRKIGIIWPFLIGDKAGEVVCSALVATCAAVIPISFAKSIKLVSPETIYSSDKIHVLLENVTGKYTLAYN